MRDGEGRDQGGGDQDREREQEREREREATAMRVGDGVRRRDRREVVTALRASGDTTALARGFRFEQADRDESLRKTPERVDDGDVVAIKSIVTAVLESQNITKFASIMVLSVFPEGKDELTSVLEGILSDTELMQATVDADPRTQFLPTTGRRKLACDGCSPVNSFICAHCWPIDICVAYFWCPASSPG